MDDKQVDDWQMDDGKADDGKVYCSGYQLTSVFVADVPLFFSSDEKRFWMLLLAKLHVKKGSILHLVWD